MSQENKDYELTVNDSMSNDYQLLINVDVYYEYRRAEPEVGVMFTYNELEKCLINTIYINKVNGNDTIFKNIPFRLEQFKNKDFLKDFENKLIIAMKEDINDGLQ